MPTDAEDDEPRLAFDDSRRLTGANRWFDDPAVVLTALGAAATHPAAHVAWRERVARLCADLGWPAPSPVVQVRPGHVLLAVTAPVAMLFTATEVNEWAWECSAAEVEDLAVAGLTRLHDFDEAQATLRFRRRSREEVSAPLQRLLAAAAARGIDALVDDDTLSLGLGGGSRSWPRAALPLPMDVPWADLHAVPTLLVTGSNGKTTTTRLLAAMFARAGRVAGLCSTEGITVGGVLAEGGDYAGPAGARHVLRDRRVEVAVLETARGGLLRRGLAVGRADVAVVTNVSEDHLGEYGIADVDDIAEVKLALARVLGPAGVLVLNGGDEVLMRVAATLPHVQRVRSALFALQFDHPRLQSHRAAGGMTCGVEDGRLRLQDGASAVDLGEAVAMPLSVGGAAAYNVENLAAAALAAHAAGLPAELIAATLATFGATPGDNPGRLERRAWRGATVLVDYAHNPDGLAQLLRVARALAPRRLSLLLGQAGNRDDAAIGHLATTAAAFAPDLVVIKELPGMLRGRLPGAVPGLLRRGLLQAGVAVDRLVDEPDEESAARRLLDAARHGDVVVLPIHTAAVRQRLAALLGDNPPR